MTPEGDLPAEGAPRGHRPRVLFVAEAVTLAHVARPLVIFEIICAVLYLIPQTAVLGAILLTAYLGGAVATHVRAAEQRQFWIPIAMGALVWLGLFLRDARIRKLVPFRF